MSAWTTIRTQDELDRAVAKGSGWLDFAAANLRIVVSVGNWRIRAAIGFRASVVARGNSSVVARGNSSVEARGNSSVEAWENSSVEAWENSSVVAWENSSVVAWENSSVVARGNSSVEAWENSSVVARGNSSVVARENSSVVARGNSSVVARGNSSVVARGNSSVEAWENSSVVAWENSSVEARGDVFVRLFAALKIKASAHVVIKMHGEARNIEGGQRIAAAPEPVTGAEWCEYYGINRETAPFAVPDLDIKVLDVVKRSGGLDMSSWHGVDCNAENWCQTTHCRAGAAICAAGAAGFELERKYGPETAGRMIYAASVPSREIPNFHAPDDEAMADIEAAAAASSS